MKSAGSDGNFLRVSGHTAAAERPVLAQAESAMSGQMQSKFRGYRRIASTMESGDLVA
jgi:hypothetical protein